MSSVSASAVLVDRWVNRSLAKSILLVVGLTGATAASAQVAIPLPFTPVPLTLQTFAVLVGAASLGATRSVLAQTLYFVLAAAGAPVLAGGAGGIDKALGATGGYLLGFIFASLVVGSIASRGATTQIKSTVFAYVAGSAVIYLFGFIWLAQFTGNGFAWALTHGVTPFIIGDVIKAVAAGLLLPSAWKLVSK
jgi:biotin transport system substrate-specific component